METPSQRDIEDVIVDLLAEDAGTSPADLRALLELEGPGLPVDSLLAVEVLVRVEARFGVQLPTTQVTADAMKSVAEFAKVVRTAIQLSPDHTHE
ncbi:MAG: acyl carrier protein [Nocardioides sp.]